MDSVGNTASTHLKRLVLDGVGDLVRNSQQKWSDGFINSCEILSVGCRETRIEIEKSTSSSDRHPHYGLRVCRLEGVDRYNTKTT